MSAFVTDRFRRALDKLLALEGGYCNDPRDHGGETKYGISKKSYPLINVAMLTRDDAAQIYHRDYWSPLHLDEFLSDVLAQSVFDFGVNAGIGTSAKALQIAANGLGHPLSVDGHVGNATVAMVNSIPEEKLLPAFRHRAMRHYETIAELDPSQHRFLKGWRNRIYGEEIPT